MDYLDYLAVQDYPNLLASLELVDLLVDVLVILHLHSLNHRSLLRLVGPADSLVLLMVLLVALDHLKHPEHLGHLPHLEHLDLHLQWH